MENYLIAYRNCDINETLGSSKLLGLEVAYSPTVTLLRTAKSSHILKAGHGTTSKNQYEREQRMHSDAATRNHDVIRHVLNKVVQMADFRAPLPAAITRVICGPV